MPKRACLNIKLRYEIINASAYIQLEYTQLIEIRSIGTQLSVYDIILVTMYHAHDLCDIIFSFVKTAASLSCQHPVANIRNVLRY